MRLLSAIGSLSFKVLKEAKLMQSIYRTVYLCARRWLFGSET